MKRFGSIAPDGFPEAFFDFVIPSKEGIHHECPSARA
jgi:hypothetical protein